MKIYIQHNGKFYKYAVVGRTARYEMAAGRMRFYIVPVFVVGSTDNPQFAPGDRVWFEALNEWTEATSGVECVNCVFDCSGECFHPCDGVIFQKIDITDSTKPEKAPEPATPAAILDNERNRMAWEILKSILSSSFPMGSKFGPYNDAALSFAYADAFIARAKEEAGK